MGFYLAPHNDDEVLFGAYTLLRHRPTVCVVLRCNQHIDWWLRTADSARACEHLGVPFMQWPFYETAPDWDQITEMIYGLRHDHVWAPLPEPGGHEQHNRIGELADLFCPNVSFYTTYTHERGRTVGEPVRPVSSWPELKQQALDCYTATRSVPSISGGFSWPLDEYYSGERDQPAAER